MILTLRGWNWGALYSFLQALLNRVLTYPNLRSGTTAANLRYDATDFCITGQVYTIAASAAAGVAITGTNTAAGQFVKVRVEIDSAGAITYAQGPVATAQVLARVPRRTANRATLGWIEIPASFIFGTTSLGASGVTIYNGDPDLAAGASLPPSDRGLDTVVYTGN